MHPGAWRGGDSRAVRCAEHHRKPVHNELDAVPDVLLRLGGAAGHGLLQRRVLLALRLCVRRCLPVSVVNYDPKRCQHADSNTIRAGDTYANAV